MSDNDTDPGSTQAIIDLAQLTAAPTVWKDELATERVALYALPDGNLVSHEDMEPYLRQPLRPRGTSRHTEQGSFVDHVKRFHEEQTTIWLHPNAGHAVAVLNDHGQPSKGGPGWGDHRAVLDLAHAPEWTYWRAQDGKYVGQVEFAEQIEQGMEEIREPAAADMLELAQHFHAASTGAFRSSHRLTDGSVQFAWSEDVNATAGKDGQITIPAEFVLGLRVFEGEALAHPVRARLRYRIREGKLSIGYALHRPDDVVREALEEIRAELAANFPRVYRGVPADALQ